MPFDVGEEYPALHVHELMPGPTDAQRENAPQPPLLDRQLLMGAQPGKIGLGVTTVKFNVVVVIVVVAGIKIKYPGRQKQSLENKDVW